jgi:hypothetical protein
MAASQLYDLEWLLFIPSRAADFLKSRSGNNSRWSAHKFLTRLRTIAMSLPKTYIKSVIARMKPNLKALVKAEGWTPKND